MQECVRSLLSCEGLTSHHCRRLLSYCMLLPRHPRHRSYAFLFLQYAITRFVKKIIRKNSKDYTEPIAKRTRATTNGTADGAANGMTNGAPATNGKAKRQ